MSASGPLTLQRSGVREACPGAGIGPSNSPKNGVICDAKLSNTWSAVRWVRQQQLSESMECAYRSTLSQGGI